MGMSCLVGVASGKYIWRCCGRRTAMLHWSLLSLTSFNMVTKHHKPEEQWVTPFVLPSLKQLSCFLYAAVFPKAWYPLMSFLLFYPSHKVWIYPSLFRFCFTNLFVQINNTSLSLETRVTVVFGADSIWSRMQTAKVITAACFASILCRYNHNKDTEATLTIGNTRYTSHVFTQFSESKITNKLLKCPGKMQDSNVCQRFK